VVVSVVGSVSIRPFDYTTLVAVCWELQQHCLPARFEQAYQWDRHTLILGLRTLQGRCWLTLCWHPQFARLHLGDAPPRTPDTFTFSKQIQSLLKGLALVDIGPVQPWERVVVLRFALRPGDPVQWQLYLEIMGKHSNAILVNDRDEIVTAGHQVSSSQSRVRPIQTGQPYDRPPGLQGAIPRREESYGIWRERVSLIPGSLPQQLVKTYRGVSTALALELLAAAGIEADQHSDRCSEVEWQALFEQWQRWLIGLEEKRFCPQPVPQGGYTVLGLSGATDGSESARSPFWLQTLIQQQYQGEIDRVEFQNLYHQLRQKLKTCLKKYYQKIAVFDDRLRESEAADAYRLQGDLLMANLQQWQPGLREIALLNFEDSTPISISLNPEKNAVQNAQILYKKHQKLKRSKDAILPLWQDLKLSIHYLEQVEESLMELGNYATAADLVTLREIQDELIEQGYWHSALPGMKSAKDRSGKVAPDSQADFQRYTTPSGYEVLVGRNNRQNDQLSFRVATDYDLWFHTQEIPGSHVLLRLPPGAQADDRDLRYVADVAAYHSRARHSDQVPVVYTQPQWIYKPKGNPPGLVIYKQATVIWGQPQTVAHLEAPRP
jgi:predicted ribosome quality control (RQC) complex YloA/Tae2 family protein